MSRPQSFCKQNDCWYFTYQGDAAVDSCTNAKTGQICSSTDGDGGNHKTTFAYNTRGDLTTIDRPAGLGDIVITYDAAGSSVVGAVTTGYGYDDVTSDERTQAGTDTITNGLNGTTFVTEGTLKVQYLRDPAGTLVEIRTKTSSNPWVPQYFTLDRLGSVIALTDSTGLTTAAPTYDPWGVTTSTAPTNPTAAANRYGYASGYTDPGTGLIKYGTRYYAPLLGVWTQSDPASQGANYYIYAGDDPITNTDPTGRDWLDDAFTAFGDVADAVATVGDAIAPGNPVSDIAGVAGTASDLAKTGWDAWGGGDGVSDGDVASDVVDGASFGAGAAFGDDGEFVGDLGANLSDTGATLWG